MLLLLFSELVLISFIVTLLLFVDFKSAIFIFTLIIIGSLYMVISKNYINKLAELRINHEGKNIKNLKKYLKI